MWLCDRYQDGNGLASVEASANEEVSLLLGQPQDGLPRQLSFLATVLSDLAAFLGNGEFYSNVVNDVKATRIYPEYWQTKDTLGQFLIDGEDVIQYLNIEYDDALASPFEQWHFAEHIREETRAYEMAHRIGPSGYLAVMLLLRDRYFPTLWPGMVARTAAQ